MKKSSGRKIPWLAIALAVCLSLAAGYFIGKIRSGKPSQANPVGQGVASKETPAEAESGFPVLRDKIYVGKVDGASKIGEDSDECLRIRKDLKDYFEYLDQKPYVQRIEPGIDTQQWFNRIIAKLSTNPPIPAGEGLDPVAIANHIFYFFRNLESKEMRLLREIMVNEASTLEANMDLFFKWLSLGNRCPEAGGVRPPPEVLYSYAGFFLNTIGGRAYLFRNSPGVRWLVTYYCLLIVHDADKRGKNVYGIDIAPHLKALTTEVNYQRDLLFQTEYLKRLEDLQGFYRAR